MAGVAIGYVQTSQENQFKIAKAENNFAKDFISEVTDSDHAAEWKQPVEISAEHFFPDLSAVQVHSYGPDPHSRWVLCGSF